MAYDIDLFTPETYQAFSKSARDMSRFQKRQKGIGARWVTSNQMECDVVDTKLMEPVQ